MSSRLLKVNGSRTRLVIGALQEKNNGTDYFGNAVPHYRSLHW